MLFSQTIKYLVKRSGDMQFHGVSVFVATCFLLICATVRTQVHTGSDELLQDYNTIEEKLLTMDGEVAKVQNFVYRKDVATFKFSMAFSAMKVFPAPVGKTIVPL